MYKLTWLMVAGIFGISGCNEKSDEYKTITSDPIQFSNVVYELNSVVMGNNFSPIVASRNYLYASVAAYEIIAAGYPDQYHSLAGQVHGLEVVPKPDPGKEINYEFASLLAFVCWRELRTLIHN